MEPSRRCYTAKQIFNRVKHLKGWKSIRKISAICTHEPDRYNFFKLGGKTKYVYGIDEVDALRLIDDIKEGRI